MKLNKGYIALATIGLGLFSGLAAHASQLNEETKITFSAPVDVPGIELAAGTYTFKLIDPDNDRSLVQILNANQTRVYATVQTVLIDRQQPTAHTEVTLAHTGPGNLPVLTEWFYPGRQTGFEFIYPRREEHKLDQAKEQTIIALPGTASQSAAGE